MTKLFTVLMLVFFLAGTAVAEKPVGGKNYEFQNHCALGVSMGKSVPCDPSYSADTTWTDATTGKQYCFGNKEAKETFAKDAKGNLAKADKNWPTVQASAGKPAQG